MISCDLFLRPVPEEGAGTGVIFDSVGYIMTNNHVMEVATSIRVTLVDGRTFDATFAEEAIWAIRRHEVGDQMSISYVRDRDGAENTVLAALAESP